MENCDGKVDSIGTMKTTIICEDGSKLTIANAQMVANPVSIQKKVQKSKT